MIDEDIEVNIGDQFVLMDIPYPIKVVTITRVTRHYLSTDDGGEYHLDGTPVTRGSYNEDQELEPVTEKLLSQIAMQKKKNAILKDIERVTFKYLSLEKLERIKSILDEK